MIWMPGDDDKLKRALRALDVTRDQLRSTIRFLAVLVRAADGQKLFIPKDAVENLPANAMVSFSQSAMRLRATDGTETPGYLLEYKEPGPPKLIVKQGGG